MTMPAAAPDLPTLPSVAPVLDERHRQCAQVLSDEPGSTLAEVTEIVGFNERRVSTFLRELADAGMANGATVRVKRAGGWIVGTAWTLTASGHHWLSERS